MDEAERNHRRLRQRERRLLRRLQLLGPLGLVGLAGLLSAGVIQVMEDPRETEVEPRQTVVETVPTTSAPKKPSLLAPDPRPDLPGTLGVSLLDHEIQGPPEENVSTRDDSDEDPALEPEPEAEIGPVSMGPTRIEPVPEPGTAVLLGCGLALLGSCRRYSTISRSSTSKVSAAPGGIGDCRGGASP